VAVSGFFLGRPTGLVTGAALIPAVDAGSEAELLAEEEMADFGVPADEDNRLDEDETPESPLTSAPEPEATAPLSDK
jgi:hypothetical protein